MTAVFHVCSQRTVEWRGKLFCFYIPVRLQLLALCMCLHTCIVCIYNESYTQTEHQRHFKLAASENICWIPHIYMQTTSPGVYSTIQYRGTHDSLGYFRLENRCSQASAQRFILICKVLVKKEKTICINCMYGGQSAGPLEVIIKLLPSNKNNFYLP